MAYQRAYLPMKVINITQGYGDASSSHKLSFAIDLAGSDSGTDSIYAPFDCKITKLYKPSNTLKSANTVWLTSTSKVMCPNGYYGYLTLSITHPSEISKMKLRVKYKQGAFLCKEGKTGNASGNHIHLEVAKGKTAGWTNKKGNNYNEYVILNKVKPEEYLFLYDDAKIKNIDYKGVKYNFVKEKDITYKVCDVFSPPLNVHKEANYDVRNIIKGRGLKNGNEVLKFYDIGSLAYIYHYEMMGYVAKRYLKKK